MDEFVDALEERLGQIDLLYNGDYGESKVKLNGSHGLTYVILSTKGKSYSSYLIIESLLDEDNDPVGYRLQHKGILAYIDVTKSSPIYDSESIFDHIDLRKAKFPLLITDDWVGKIEGRLFTESYTLAMQMPKNPSLN